MNQDFWLERWHKMEIGFHLPEVNAVLLKYAERFPEPDGQHILVPLCGKTVDIIWLLERGYRVTGIELSDIALKELAEQIETVFGWTLDYTASDAGACWKHERVTLIQGDFFAVTPEQLGPVALVYDRAALVALPAPMRGDYVQHLKSLSPLADQFLVTLDYDQQRMDGPPFALSDDEVQQHYTATHSLEAMEERQLIENEPRFRARGLESFIQRCYWLKPLS
ncbi:MAG: thiopurine S-methyltransferase [Oceanobacter sp.]|jgi:thiopurine S-methyltransferase